MNLGANPLDKIHLCNLFMMNILLVIQDKDDIAYCLHIVEQLKNKEDTDRDSKAKLIVISGRYYVQFGEWKKALEYYEQVGLIFHEQKDKRSLAVTKGDKARILTSLGKIDEALQLHEEELKQQ